MPTGWGKRIERAILTYAATHGRTTLARWGELIAEREGRASPYSKGTVGDWISEKNEPTLGTFDAMAGLVGADPWWFPWGSGRPPADTKASTRKQSVTRPVRGHVPRKQGGSTE